MFQLVLTGRGWAASVAVAAWAVMTACGSGSPNSGATSSRGPGPAQMPPPGLMPPDEMRPMQPEDPARSSDATESGADDVVSLQPRPLDADEPGSMSGSTPPDEGMANMNPSPQISSVQPGSVARGQSVEIRGEGFSETATVLFDSFLVIPTIVAPGTLSVVVPYALPVVNCAQDYPVTVTNDGKDRSAATSVTVTGGAPLPDELPVIAAGQMLTVSGINLGNVEVRLGGNVLLPGLQPLQFQVPPEFQPGEAVLAIGNGCETWQEVTTVFPPLPSVLNISQLQVAPGGVVFVWTDRSAPSELIGAVVGDRVISPAGTEFSRPPYSDPVLDGSIGIRIPADIPGGPTTLRLIGPGGEGPSMSLQVSQGILQTTVPPPSKEILFAPSARSPDATYSFPTGTSNREAWMYPLSSSNNWWYYIVGADSARDPGLEILTCDGIGTLVGAEWYFSSEVADAYTATATPRDAENAIEGTIRLTPTENRVELTITRDGVPEAYVGGYVTLDGRPPTARDRTRLLLTSTTTGFQLDILQRLDSFNLECP